MGDVKNPKDHKTPGLGYGHAYGLIGFDHKADKVTVWNPWGNNFKPKGAEGPEHGYTTTNGVFNVPIHEFYKVFSTAHFESDKKLVPTNTNHKPTSTHR